MTFILVIVEYTLHQSRKKSLLQIKFRGGINHSSLIFLNESLIVHSSMGEINCHNHRNDQLKTDHLQIRELQNIHLHDRNLLTSILFFLCQVIKSLNRFLVEPCSHDDVKTPSINYQTVKI